MDASQYKDFVLALIFMKYESVKYKGDPYGMVVLALQGDKEIGEMLNKFISELAEENELRGLSMSLTLTMKTISGKLTT